VHRVRAGEGDLAVLFRDDVLSNHISFRKTDPRKFVADLARVGGHEEAYVVTAMDAETFGHHITDWEREFLAETFALLEQSGTAGEVQMVLPSELIAHFPPGETIEPYRSSWSTSRDDLKNDNPFPLWHAPGNTLHRLQWEYVEHCIALTAFAREHAGASPEAEKFASFAEARLQPALHSCQFWWASQRPMWDVTMIHRGFLVLSEVLLHASRSVLLGDASRDSKQAARWRVADADALRAQIERELREVVAP
jgi:alpha-amylase/alpha-mannosidase (GH57 family)